MGIFFSESFEWGRIEIFMREESAQLTLLLLPSEETVFLESVYRRCALRVRHTDLPR